MGARQEYEKRVEKKMRDIAELEGQLRESRAVLQAYQEFLKHLPQESGETKASTALRPGTDLYKVWQFLRGKGRPAYINDLLTAIGKEVTNKNRVSLSGNLSWHVRKGETFTRPQPNTFGLIGMPIDDEDAEATKNEPANDSGDSLPVEE